MATAGGIVGQGTMTSSVPGTGTCFVAKGLDISLAALQRHDPYINNIMDLASQVALYTFSHKSNEWEKTDVEGSLFVYTRSASPRHGFTIMNRLSMDNRTEPITKDLDLQLQDPFLLYRNARLSIYGIWFYDQEDCWRIAELMKNLTQQELLKAQQGGGSSPRTLHSGDSRGVDILEMLTKARDEYDKGNPSSEPKEIAVSSVIFDNPNLIKPIPVKPTERHCAPVQHQQPRQGNPSSEPKEIAVSSVIFDNPNLIKPIPVKPTERHCAPVQHQQPRQDGESEPKHLSLAALFGAKDKSVPVSTMRQDSNMQSGGAKAENRPAVLRSLSYEELGQAPAKAAADSSTAHPCLAFQKLMTLRGGGVELRPVSESPENRQCENGGFQPASCPDRNPLHRLFHPPASACSHQQTQLQGAPNLSKPDSGVGPPAEPLGFSSSSSSHQSQPLFFSHSGPQLVAPSPRHPVSGVVYPHELIQRLQLVQQEQNPDGLPRPTLAARFHEPLSQSARPLVTWAEKSPSGEKSNPLFQVSSPQRIPATVAPTLLMSPMEFSQSKAGKPTESSRLAMPPAESCQGLSRLLSPRQAVEPVSLTPSTLTKGQLQDTLLYLIKNDSSFLNTIYEAYLTMPVVMTMESEEEEEDNSGAEKEDDEGITFVARAADEVLLEGKPSRTFAVLTSYVTKMALFRVRAPIKMVKLWADAFGGEMFSLATKYSGSHLLQKKYKDVESIIKIEEVDGLELVRKFAEEMEEMLGRKMKAVKRLVNAAEDADLYHEYNASLEYDYFNSVKVNERDDDGNYVELGSEFILESNKHFNNLPVNTSLSNIQVPTNVYNKDPGILNGVYMSEALNPLFVENFERDPTLTWQYFGSYTGFFRLYPGIKWQPDENGVIAFDCRNRNWYIQAATSPKDIVIVVDISGSMKGLRLSIAKHTITTILDTLGENDFVNIIAYNDYVHYVEPCFKGTLVQADLDNREHFKLLVEELHAKGMGTVKKALKEAFSILSQFNVTGQGSLCNQAIMLITDGAVEDYKQVFEDYNWPDRKVRVFTYLIGREVTFADNAKWIACNNKGYYTQISTLADVQENVMEYLHVLSRPMVINHDHDIIWTEAYMDSALFASQAQSLLLMTTVAMPVFSKKNETRSEGILLGVVGSDVPLGELLKLAPRYKLGVHGYAFLNTNNGYILSHPDLRPLLRTAMVNGETGAFSNDVRMPMEKGRRVLFLTNDYFYTVIKETPFSLGVVLTRGHGEYIFIGNISVEEGLHDLQQPDLTLPDEWIYCVTDIDPHHRKLSQLQAVIRYLTGEEPDLECDEELVQEVLFDAVVTAPLEAYWTALVLNSSNSADGVEVAFLGTRAGLVRFSLFVGSEKRVNKKFLTKADKDSIFTMDHFPLWYRRAAEHPPGSFIYYTPYEEGRVLEYLNIVTHWKFLTKADKDSIFTMDHFPLWYRRAAEHPPGSFIYYTPYEEGRERRSSSVIASTVVSVTVNKKMAIAAAHKHKKQDMLQPCDTEYPAFVYEPSVKETNSLIECGTCQK
ncbi:Voltage-dependent calcium channel subunit alpha-2/delta-4 [Acipenser ruthenus]|uniref:5'-(N(7)-methylguanosine 5'-triphospho)-[mRNA] hydrolase n=1 Tax=Acipenser ruthenus TaxID=7906 RepID=A0A662YYK7_ACIRT|nr:Voltage-dependent calcium channel subunit alpha-2/delta-4 [Acipenser ruthenus]